MTLSDAFLITIPFDKKKEDDCEEEIPECVSGDTFSTAINPSGCEVLLISLSIVFLFKKMANNRPFCIFSFFFEQLLLQNNTHIICECTHLTAFSALFVPNGNSCEVCILYFL